MNELSKPTKIMRLKNGVELYLDEEKSDHLTLLLTSEDCPKFIKHEGRLIAISEITGLFDPADLEGQQRRRSGQWQDADGGWHDRGERICPNCKTTLPEGKQCGNCR